MTETTWNCGGGFVVFKHSVDSSTRVPHHGIMYYATCTRNDTQSQRVLTVSNCSTVVFGLVPVSGVWRIV